MWSCVHYCEKDVSSGKMAVNRVVVYTSLLLCNSLCSIESHSHSDSYVYIHIYPHTNVHTRSYIYIYICIYM